MKIRNGLIHNGESGIEYYPGYLPKLLRVVLFGERRAIWKETIEKLDVYPEILREIYETKHADLNDKKFVIELEEWIKNNPKYSFLVEY